MPAGSTYSTIATTTVSSAANTVTLSSIPSTYTDLILVVQGTTSTGTGTHSVTLRVNGDTGTNYSVTIVDGSGSSVATYAESNQTSLNLGIFATPNQANSIFCIQNYANTTTNKTFLGRGNNSNDYLRVGVGLWRNTVAINSVSIFNSATTFAAGTTMTLYGITAA